MGEWEGLAFYMKLYGRFAATRFQNWAISGNWYPFQLRFFSKKPLPPAPRLPIINIIVHHSPPPLPTRHLSPTARHLAACLYSPA